jgi:hypothetical protein
MSISKWRITGAALTLVVLLGGFLGIAVTIGSGVRNTSDAAVAEYGGDRVDALIAVVESPAHSLTDRNRAVWALGQLGEARALPVLERHYTGERCDHTRLICQHELEKAIRLCRGSKNVSAFIWR